MVNDNLLETDRKRYADDVTVQELVRLRVENERLREALGEIIINCDWPDRVERLARSARQQKESK